MYAPNYKSHTTPPIAKQNTIHHPLTTNRSTSPLYPSIPPFIHPFIQPYLVHLPRVRVHEAMKICDRPPRVRVHEARENQSTNFYQNIYPKLTPNFATNLAQTLPKNLPNILLKSCPKLYLNLPKYLPKYLPESYPISCLNICSYSWKYYRGFTACSMPPIDRSAITKAL